MRKREEKQKKKPTIKDKRQSDRSKENARQTVADDYSSHISGLIVGRRGRGRWSDELVPRPKR
jgi:hypothetical protein